MLGVSTPARIFPFMSETVEVSGIPTALDCEYHRSFNSQQYLRVAEAVQNSSPLGLTVSAPPKLRAIIGAVRRERIYRREIIW